MTHSSHCCVNNLKLMRPLGTWLCCGFQFSCKITNSSTETWGETRWFWKQGHLSLSLGALGGDNFHKWYGEELMLVEPHPFIRVRKFSNNLCLLPFMQKVAMASQCHHLLIFASFDKILWISLFQALLRICLISLWDNDDDQWVRAAGGLRITTLPPPSTRWRQKRAVADQRWKKGWRPLIKSWVSDLYREFA